MRTALLPLFLGVALAVSRRQEAPERAASTGLPPPAYAFEPSSRFLEVIRRLVRGFVVRAAAERRVPGAARHVAAVLEETGDPNAMLAALLLLGRGLPPALHAVEPEPEAAVSLAAALLAESAAEGPAVAATLGRLLVAGEGEVARMREIVEAGMPPPLWSLLALGRCGGAADVKALRPFLPAGDLRTRHAAAAAAAALADPTAASWLEGVLDSASATIRADATRALALVGPRGLVPPLLEKALEDRDPSVSIPAALSLLEAGRGGSRIWSALGRGRVDRAGLIAAVRAAAANPSTPGLPLARAVFASAVDHDASLEAFFVIARSDPRAGAGAARFAIRWAGADVPVLALAARLLAALEGAPSAQVALVQRLGDSDPAARAAAAYAFGEIAGPEAARAVASRLDPDDPAVAAAIVGAAAGLR